MIDAAIISAGIKIVTDLFSSSFKDAIEEKSKDLLKNSSDSIWKWLKNKNEEYDIFKHGAERYVEQMYNRYNRIKVLGMSDFVPLENLYVKAYVLNKIKARNKSDDGELKAELETFQKKQNTLFGEGKKRDAFDIVNEKEKFVILGKPGAGKSTFLKYVAIQSLNKNATLKTKRIPVFISLKEYSDSGKSLMKCIVDEFKVCGFENPEPYIETILKQGRCMILLDGLDEVSDSVQTSKAVRDIRDVIEEYNKCQCIISCRSAAYYNSFDAFSDVEIADFDLPQIENFISNFFKSKPHNTSELIEKIQSEPAFLEFASTPLLLAFLCIYFEGNATLTSNRAELYKEAIDVLLTRWDATRGIKRTRKYPEINKKKELNLLNEWAYETFKNDVYFFKKHQLEQFLEQYLVKKLGLQHGVGAELLSDMEATHSLIFERQYGIYSFAHLTIHEYFTASHIYENSLDGKLDDTMKSYSTENRWREVFLILFNMSTNETTIDRMLDILKAYVNRIQVQNPSINELWALVAQADSHKKFENCYSLFLCALDKAEAVSPTKNKQVLIETYKALFKALSISTDDYRIFRRELKSDVVDVIFPVYKHINTIEDSLFINYSLTILRMVECLKEADILSNNNRDERILQTLNFFVPMQN